MNRNLFLALGLSIVAWAQTNQAQAVLIYDEGVLGDASDVHSTPTSTLPIVFGVSTITGAVDVAGGDLADVFTTPLPAGLTVTGFDFSNLSSSSMTIDVTLLGTTTSTVGGPLVVAASSTLPGIAYDPTAEQLVVSQAVFGSPSSYSMDIQAVPEPGTMMLCGLGLCVVGGSRRLRRRRHQAKS